MRALKARSLPRGAGRLCGDQVKSYLHYCITEKQDAASTLNQIISAVRIFFVDVLQRPWEPLKLKRPRKDKKLPVVFSKQEMTAFFEAVKNLKHKAIFVTAYSSGLRLGEVRMLKPGDTHPARVPKQWQEPNPNAQNSIQSKITQITTLSLHPRKHPNCQP